MAMKQAEYVTGYKTSDGVIHSSSIDAVDHQDRLNLIEVIGGAVPYTAVGIADLLLKRYRLRENEDYVEPLEVPVPNPIHVRPVETGFHSDELPPFVCRGTVDPEDDDIPF